MTININIQFLLTNFLKMKPLFSHAFFDDAITEVSEICHDDKILYIRVKIPAILTHFYLRISYFNSQSALISTFSFTYQRIMQR